MPGIVALITKLPPENSVRQFARMLESLRQESFYVTGTWIDESTGIYLGWTRRPDEPGEMPLHDERGEIVLGFSGEEFPDPGTVQRLRQRGHAFQTDGLAHLVHLYEEDPSFPAGLNGRFHGLLVDRRHKFAILFNDRYGMHRLYYHASEDAFYFAAEAKAILAVRPELRAIDFRALGEFVACGAVLDNRTLFRGINLLPPASAWIFRNGNLERKASYFDPRDWEEQETLNPEAYYRELREVFIQNLPRYFSGDRRIAMSLTGGLDTRMILACRRTDPSALPCYTFGSMFRENQDVRVSRRVAKVCGQSHQVITVGQEFLQQFPRYAERAVFLTDGCVDVGRAPDLYLNEQAREIAPVRMTGNYGGEILRRVRAFKPEPHTGLFCSEFQPYIQRAWETYASTVKGHPVAFAAFRQAPWYQHGVLGLEQTQLSMRSPFLDNDLVRTVFRSPLAALSSNQVSMRLIGDGNPALLQIPTDRGTAGRGGALVQSARKMFRDFLFKAEYASDVGMPQWLARIDHAISPFRLEHMFLGQHKVFHFRVWYRNALAGYVREILLDPLTLSRPFVEKRVVEAVIMGHIRGDHNYTSEIHKALTLELLHRIFIDDHGSNDSRDLLEDLVTAQQSTAPMLTRYGLLRKQSPLCK